ncbi:E3 ubiquitin-protein ligase RNF19A-like [Dysidea avara]|uniref:E3 ubiquitin-protein ligase RNF19A-like n=1 Tax=Dysidea avara TaxID=196820 RepID=UPI00331B056A
MASERVCPVCYLQQDKEPFQFRECRHQFCWSCVRSHCVVRLKEFHVSVPCLYPHCSAQLTPTEIQSLVGEEVFMQYLEQTLRRWLAKEQGARLCPAPDCPYAELLQHPRSACEMKFVCQHPDCGKMFCYNCKKLWHPGQECAPNSEEGDTPCKGTKPCPRCGCFIMKEEDGSCNHMKCSFCGTDFCWLCLREIGEFHYFSPSGCTFWGERTWSVRRRWIVRVIIWTIAPVVILLVSLLAFPVITVVIPVMTGYQLYQRNYKTKLRKFLSTLTGIGLTSIISPFVGLFGSLLLIPLGLIYVYGIIPIHLMWTSDWRHKLAARLTRNRNRSPTTPV